MLDPLSDEEHKTVLMLLGDGWRYIKCRGYYAHLYRGGRNTAEGERVRLDELSLAVLSPEEVEFRKGASDTAKAWYPR